MDSTNIQLFRRTLRKFERLTQIFNESCCQEVTVAQCHVLLEIEHLKITTTIELAKQLLLDKSTLSRTIEALVIKGLVKREKYPNDRRFTKLLLTDKGKTICNKINDENNKKYNNAFQRLAQERRNEIIMNFEVLTHMMQVVFTEGGSEPCNC